MPPMPGEPLTREHLARIAQWALDTCLMFGSCVSTAYLVAGTLAQGLEREVLPIPLLSQFKHR